MEAGGNKEFSMEGKELLIPYSDFCIKTRNKNTGHKVRFHVHMYIMMNVTNQIWQLFLDVIICKILMAKQTFIGLAYKGKDIVFRFIIEYSSLRDFGPWVRIGLFLYEHF
jgi:hypothetical protein